MNRPVVKIAVVGKMGVGKSLTISRMCGKKTSSSTSAYEETPGLCVREANLTVDKKKVLFGFWEVGGGSGDYQDINKLALEDANCVVIFFSISDRSSVDSLPAFISKAKEYKQRNIIAVGTHLDMWMSAEMSQEQVKQLSQDLSIPIRLISNDIEFTSSATEENSIEKLLQLVYELSNEP